MSISWKELFTLRNIEPNRTKQEVKTTDSEIQMSLKMLYKWRYFLNTRTHFNCDQIGLKENRRCRNSHIPHVEGYFTDMSSDEWLLPAVLYLMVSKCSPPFREAIDRITAVRWIKHSYHLSLTDFNWNTFLKVLYLDSQNIINKNRPENSSVRYDRFDRCL